MQMASQDGEGLNEINITPFVDIVLVLLIIFMISTPALVHRGMKVALPKAVIAEDMSHVTLKLMLMADGKLLLDARPITLADLDTAVKKLNAANVPVDAIVAADGDVTHRKVIEISDLLRGYGVADIGFGVEPKKK